MLSWIQKNVFSITTRKELQQKISHLESKLDTREDLLEETRVALQEAKHTMLELKEQLRVKNNRVETLQEMVLHRARHVHRNYEDKQETLSLFKEYLRAENNPRRMNNRKEEIREYLKDLEEQSQTEPLRVEL